MSDPLPPDPYKALGIPKDAAADAVKKAFRKLALTCHPDKTKALPDADRKAKEEQFHCIKNAHDLLTDDDERRRYDLKVERDSLLRRPTYGPSKTSHAGAPPSRPQPNKSTTTPIFQTRPVYEFREPKASAYEAKKSPYDDYQRPRYETRRPAPKPAYEDYNYDDVSPASSRRTSGRVPEEKERRERRVEDERLQRKLDEQRLKEEEKKLRADRERRREFQRRQDASYKHSARVESDSESDSDRDRDRDRYRPPPRPRSPERRPKYDDRKAEPRKSSRREEEKARRSRSEESESDNDDKKYGKSYNDRINEREAFAAQYIKKSSGKTPVEKDDRHDRKSVMTRSKTNAKRAAPPPPAPPAPPVDSTAKRSSTRRGSEKVKSASTRERLHIVDPPRDDRDERDDYFGHDDRDRRETRETRKAAGSRTPLSSRAATFNEKAPEKPVGLKRAQTSPLAQMVSSSAGHTPARSSKLKHAETQDYSSSSSDEEPAPRYTTSTMYRYNDNSGDDRRAPPRAQVVEISPERESPRRRDESPRNKHYFAERERERPATTSHRRAPPVRSNTYEPEATRRPAAHSASNSGDKKYLFGEVNYSPKYSTNDIKYTDYGGGRRGSVDDTHSRKERTARDYMENMGRAHPGMGNRTTSYAQESFA